MPALDEEFKQEATHATSGLAMRFLYSMPGRIKAARNDLGLARRSRESREAADRLDAQAESDREAIRAARERHEAGLSPEPGSVEGHVAGGVAFKTLAAESAEEAAAISAVLAEHGIEHYASVEGMLDANPDSDRMSGFGAEGIDAFDFERGGRAPSGLFEVYVPDREAAEFFAPAEYPYQVVVGSPQGYTLLADLPNTRHAPGEVGIRAFLDEHDVEAVKGRISLNDACAKAGEEVLWGEGLAPSTEELERLGIAGDGLHPAFSFDVETVPWDAEARIVTDGLEALGIPFETEVVERAAGKSHGVVRIAIAELHAGYAKQVVDGLAEGVRGFSRERVRNYEALAATADLGTASRASGTDRAFRSEPLPADQLHKVTCALQEMGIEHEVVEIPEEGAFEVMVMEGEVRDKGFRINRAAEVVERIRPPELKEQAQRAYEQSPRARRSRERARRNVEEARERDKATHTKRRRSAKVSLDVEEATKSAEAQRRAAAETQRHKSLGL